ncbi:hypothetical protein SLE2022_113960 [Rubroshorea leprosula]
MQASWLPSSIHNEIDRISRNFIWGSDESHRKLHLVSWDTICQPKESGGLGIKKARDANLISMAKLNWRLHTDKGHLWRDVISKKYRIDDPHAPLPTSGSPVIKSIAKGYSTFKDGIRWTPGTGHSIFFWSDCWVGKAPLNTILYGPFSPDAANLLLSDIIVNDSIDLHAVDYPIPQEIVSAIAAVPLPRYSSESDHFCWGGESDGSFSSASAFHMLTVKVSSQQKWKWIWKTPTIPKIQIFLWLLFHGRVKTLDYLCSLGITQESTCSLCKTELESIDHLFRSCSVTKSVLEHFLPDTISNDQMGIPFSEWLQNHCRNLTPSSLFNIPRACVFTFLIWVIWNHRNCIMYRQDSLNTQHLLHCSVNKIVEFWSSINHLSANSTRIPRLFSWTPPPPNWIKINTDGSVMGNPGPAGCGGILRDSQGQWIMGFIRNIGDTTVLAAELWAIRDGLSIAVNLQLQKVIIESDCQIAIKLLTDGVNNFHPHSNLIMDCKVLLSNIHQARIQHSPRQCNMAADALAKKGVGSSFPSFDLLYDCPPDVGLFCLADIVGVCYPRT